MHMFDMNPVELEQDPQPTWDPINDMFFLLFTRDNPQVGQRIDIYNEASLAASNWRPTAQTRFQIHGWTASAESGENPRTRDEFLALGDYNVVVVDWSVGAGSPNYITSRNRVGSAGQVVGQFIDWLTGLGVLHPSRTNIIGISLGCVIKYFVKNKINNFKFLQRSCIRTFRQKYQKWTN
jgi:pimeloyl-ACP methyl ester carboxylesterase